MLSEDQRDLIQRDVDGDLTAAEQHRLRALLETDADARAPLVALRAVATELEAVPAFDAPAGAAAEVMRALSAHHASAHHGWISAARAHVAAAAAAVTGGLEDMMSRRAQIVWSISAAAVVVLAALWITGTIPRVDNDADATIGAAKRHQAQQLSDKDVKLSDSEAQAFMQSETFDRLLKDENARKLLSNASMRALLADAELRAAFANIDFAAAIRSWP